MIRQFETFYLMSKTTPFVCLQIKTNQLFTGNWRLTLNGCYE